MEQPIHKGTQTIEENELYYELYQHPEERPTLILLHGFLSSTFCYRKLLSILTEKYTVYLIDIPPFGQSGKSSKYTYSLTNIAKTILTFIDMHKLEKVILIGHSMGGQIGLNMCKQRPDLIEKIILLAGSGYLAAPSRWLKRASYVPFFSYFVKRYLEKSGIEKNLRQVVYDQSMIDDDMRDGYTAPFLQGKAIFKALGKMARDKEDDLTENDLHTIHTNCLLLWGRYDKVVPLSIGKRLHKDLPCSQLIIIEDTGHLLPEEKPEEVFHHINNFITNEG